MAIKGFHGLGEGAYSRYGSVTPYSWYCVFD